MKFIASSVLLCLFGSSLLLAQDGESETKLPSYWMTDLAKAKAKATEENKKLLVVFSTSWCSPCQALVKKVYPEKTVEEALSSHVCVYVDGDKHAKALSTYKVRAFPTLIIEDAKGTELNRRVGLEPKVDSFIAFVNAKPKPKTPKVVKDQAAPVALNEDAKKAIAAIASLAERAWSAKAEITVDDESEESDGMQMMMPGMEPRPLFDGALVIDRSQTGDALIASVKPLPGLSLYAHGKNVIAQRTCKVGSEFDYAFLQGDLCALLDSKTLAERPPKGGAWKKKVNEETKSVTMTVALSPDDLGESEGENAPMGMPRAMMEEVVMEGALALVWNGEGRLTRILLEVMRSSPMATMAAAMSDSEDGMMDMGAMDDLELMEGRTSTYRLDFTATVDVESQEKKFLSFRSIAKGK